MMDTVFFILGITAVLGINFYVLHRINRNSYLHTRRQLPKLRSRRDETVMPPPKEDPALTRSEFKDQQYVEWYTSRAPAGQNRRQHLFESAPPESDPVEGRAFVGMAILTDEEEETKEEKQARSDKKKGNVERWFEQASNH